MGVITGWRISFFSSADRAAELIAKMPTREAVSTLILLSGERFIRVISKIEQNKKEELLSWMGSSSSSKKVLNSLATNHILYLINSVSSRTKRTLVQEMRTKKILEILSEASKAEKSCFLFLFDSSKISDIFKEMKKKGILSEFINTLSRSDRVEVILNADPETISGVVKGWKKDEILEVAEKISQETLKRFLDGLPEGIRKFILRKLSIGKVMSLVSNLQDKEHITIILNGAGPEVFSRVLAKLPQKQVTSILSFLSKEEKAELFERLDLSRMLDIISSWNIEQQAECINLMNTERASLLIDEIPVGSKIEILKILPPSKSAGMLEFRNVAKQDEVMKMLPFERMVEIFELLPGNVQKEIMEGWDFEYKHKVFNIMTPIYASRILKSLHTGGRLRVIEGVKSKQCAEIMSSWSVEDILTDFREAAFVKHVTDIIKKMDNGLRKQVIAEMDLLLKNRLGL